MPETTKSETYSVADANNDNQAVLEKMQEKDARRFEDEHVTQVYNAIAPHFSKTRYKAWPFIESFLKGIPESSLVADVGCGNGKYLGVNQACYMLGSDMCRGFEAIVADGLRLPYRSNSFDYAISIAVIHHFSTQERRLNALRELLRILKPGGQFLVYVWAFEQKTKRKQKFEQQDVFVPWHLQKQYVGFASQSVNKVKGDTSTKTTNSTALDETVNQEKATGQEEVFKRYYHLFVEGELENLVMELGSDKVELKQTTWEADNWGAVVVKK